MPLRWWLTTRLVRDSGATLRGLAPDVAVRRRGCKSREPLDALGRWHAIHVGTVGLRLHLPPGWVWGMASRNLFQLGRTPGLEDQLTEMLAWLVSAVPEAGNAMLELAFGDLDVGAAELEMTTQQAIPGGRLDAVLRTESLVLVVESKLGTSYGEGQLRWYVDWLASEHKDVAQRGLMTLTASDAPWPADELAHAAELAVVASARRWHDLHTALSSLTSALDGLQARLVQEFLDMLGAEGLIPVAPLEGDELGDAWRRSSAVIERYHSYFRACTETIGAALQASPQGRSASAQATYIWLDFVTADGEKIAFGLEDSDRQTGISRELHREAPIIWFAVEAPDWPAWEATRVKLDASPPEGWRRRPLWYGQRPWMWRCLDDVVGTGSLVEQQSALATAVAEVRDWLLSAKTSSPVDPGVTTSEQADAPDRHSETH